MYIKYCLPVGYREPFKNFKNLIIQSFTTCLIHYSQTMNNLMTSFVLIQSMNEVYSTLAIEIAEITETPKEKVDELKEMLQRHTDEFEKFFQENVPGFEGMKNYQQPEDN